MIPIYIEPNIATIGPFILSWHGLFSAIGVLFGVTIGVRMAAARGVDEDATYSLALWSVVGGIVGARLFHVVDAWSYYSQNPLQIVMITEGGIAIYGAVIGGVLTGTIYAMVKRMPVGHLADAGAVGLILGQAIGRIGDVINGEHHGLPSTAPWSVTYLHPNTLGELGVSVHLTIGYELVWNLIVFALLVAAFDRVRRSGMLFWTYFLLYAIGRFVTGFYRVDTDVAFGLGQAQIVGFVTALLAAAVLIWLYWRDRHSQASRRRAGRTVTRSR
ncbi:MAG TPA: prolipoprotein diacylglyceryl transferase [Chloroflexota bacterium]|nr:prolipoprotein diacylglyceryl transferase [Chloroflexota bacterium]